MKLKLELAKIEREQQREAREQQREAGAMQREALEQQREAAAIRREEQEREAALRREEQEREIALLRERASPRGEDRLKALRDRLDTGRRSSDCHPCQEAPQQNLRSAVQLHAVHDHSTSQPQQPREQDHTLQETSIRAHRHGPKTQLPEIVQVGVQRRRAGARDHIP
ncbi:luc7-like protein 3 [Procambarus clarkii]|uniref:luc7-like protein 3 n=1 Tax=Procambarus clarkii TaxID=6728 RepID=UPI0037428CD6